MLQLFVKGIDGKTYTVNLVGKDPLVSYIANKPLQFSFATGQQFFGVLVSFGLGAGQMWKEEFWDLFTFYLYLPTCRLKIITHTWWSSIWSVKITWQASCRIFRGVP